MLIVTGYNSTIVQAILKLVPKRDPVVRVSIKEDPPLDAERYLFAAGYLVGKTKSDQTPNEVRDTWHVNTWWHVDACEKIIAANAQARICIIGSESGFEGSYDETYSDAKASLHTYIEGKKLRKPGQQLVGISPGIIGDSGMTQRREDFDNLVGKMNRHPKERFLQAVEVARLAHYLLYVDLGYISGTIVRIHGGDTFGKI
jgi:NAD(P)-dependent dehydrogenase (short-subunit alcohol dehydrogenase family)